MQKKAKLVIFLKGVKKMRFCWRAIRGNDLLEEKYFLPGKS